MWAIMGEEHILAEFDVVTEGIFWEIKERRDNRYGHKADQALDDIPYLAEQTRKLVVEGHLDPELAKEYALNVAAACVAALEQL